MNETQEVIIRALKKLPQYDDADMRRLAQQHQGDQEALSNLALGHWRMAIRWSNHWVKKYNLQHDIDIVESTLSHCLSQGLVHAMNRWPLEWGTPRERLWHKIARAFTSRAAQTIVENHAKRVKDQFLTKAASLEERDDEGRSLGDILPGEMEEMFGEMDIQKAFDLLDSQQREVLHLRLGYREEKRSVEKTAQMMGISERMVNRLFVSAIHSLKTLYLGNHEPSSAAVKVSESCIEHDGMVFLPGFV